jgi:hypothetical protein
MWLKTDRRYAAKATNELHRSDLLVEQMVD